VPKNSCATFGATGDVGAPCSSVPSSAFPDGDGGDLQCDCSNGGGKSNNSCVGSSATHAGTCQCAPFACNGDCTQDGQSDGCGGALSCGCKSPTVCGAAKTCCTPYTCANLPPGVPSGSCGTFSDPCTNSNFACGDCTGGGAQPNGVCTLVAGQPYGSCTCTPKPCGVPPPTGLGTGPYSNNGCGQSGNCGG
jgi:hypothetical protein